MLTSSQHVRDELIEAVNRLDSYIDLLKIELTKRDNQRSERAGDEFTPPPA